MNQNQEDCQRYNQTNIIQKIVKVIIVIIVLIGVLVVMIEVTLTDIVNGSCVVRLVEKEQQVRIGIDDKGMKITSGYELDCRLIYIWKNIKP